MRILFIFPDLAPNLVRYGGAVSYGIASLSAALKGAGHRVDLLHLVAPPREAEFRALVREARPDLVAFSTNSHYARRLGGWAAWAKEESGAPVAVGGVHATLAPEAVAAIPDVDFTCVGEGESALLEICRALETGADPSGIGSLWVRRGGSIRRNPVRPPVADLTSLPDPDLGLFDFSRLLVVRRGWFPYLMSRGCAFRCTYCCVHALRELAPADRRFWRFLPPGEAAAQLRRLIDRHAPEIGKVQFLDAIFFPHPRWLREFSRAYRDLVGKPFACNLRADFVTPEIASILKEMGCETVRFGVESGDEEMTSRVLDRGLTTGQIRRAFEITREAGLKRWSYNIVGLPEETLPRALRTVRLNAELDPDFTIPFLFYPYPGTRLHDRCAAEGNLTDREFDHYMMGVTTRVPGFEPRDILFVHRFFIPLIRLYAVGNRWPGRWGERWRGFLDRVLPAPWFPRGAMVSLHEGYRAARHRLGDFLAPRAPRLYRFLGGTGPG